MTSTEPVGMTDHPEHRPPSSIHPGFEARPFILFATPSLRNAVCIDFFASALETTRLLMDSGYINGFKFIGGDPYLAKVRNYLATEFLRLRDATHLFFLDDDLCWDAAAALRFIKADKDVVAGVYPKKSDTMQWPCELLVDDNGKLVEENGLLRARAVPTGFLCIKRYVIEKFAAISGRYNDINGVEAINIFQMGFNLTNPEAGTGSWWGEDYAWCEQWNRMGGEIWVDPDIEFGHRGEKTWRGNFRDAVAAHKASPKYLVPKPDPEIEQRTPAEAETLREALNGSGVADGHIGDLGRGLSAA